MRSQNKQPFHYFFFHPPVASSATSPGVVARTLACIADVLGVMAGERAGLRSGPARNESWVNAFDLLDVSVKLVAIINKARDSG